jgi:phospholipid/cholesterol/gamma-HCH transport system substrate-binding protein
LLLYANFNEIGGLKPRAQVVIAGVKVGQVKSINLDKDFRARVGLDLRPDLQLPSDTSASIMTSGLLGDQYISLQLGGDEKMLKSGDDINLTESAVVLERLIGKLVHGTDVKGE